nr:MAG TPA: Lower collar protein [Caudoviricetes sp.]
MAVYTVELGTLVKRGYPIALNNYPIFDEGHRAILNNKIIRHYYFREICCDSPERFNFYLETKMDEIMPYYNQLYKSELLEYNPLATEFYNETNSLSKEAKKAVENYIKKIAEESTGDNYSGSKRENLNEDTKRDASGTETNKATRTDKLKEVAVTAETNSNTRTDDLTEAVETTIGSTKNSDATNNSTTTNALKTTNSSENSGSGTSKTSGSKVTGFSDIPQAGYETTVTENADGSVTTTSKGYLTTRTTESTNEQNATTTKETGKATTDNTGTVTVKSELKQKDEIAETNSSTKTNTGTVENAGSVDKTVTKDNTGTQNNDSDGTMTETETGSKTNKNNIYEDTQRNVFVSSKNVGENAEQEKRHEKENGELFAEGRRGISPADLIRKYREIIQNVDMMIIDELNDLFMGVF